MALKLYNTKDLEKIRQEKEAVLNSDDSILLGMASMYEEMLEKDAENKMALVEIYETLLGGAE